MAAQKKTQTPPPAPNAIQQPDPVQDADFAEVGEGEGEPKGHVFEGEPDERQGGEISVSRHRPQYRKLNPQEMELHNAIKDMGTEFDVLVGQIDSDAKPAAAEYKQKAYDAIELAVMYAVKGLTA